MSREKGIRFISDANGIDIEINLVKDAEGLIIGGMVYGDTTEQNKALILSSHQGENKEYPELGCGVEDILNDNDFLLWERKITSMLEADGMKIDRIKIKHNSLELIARY